MNMKIEDLKKGMEISSAEIQLIFKVSNQGGMRRSLKTNSLVLISNKANYIEYSRKDSTYNPYSDKWVDGVLHYTGMGKAGNQSFLYMQNKTVYNSKTNGINMYLFEVLSPSVYTFKGKVKLAKDPYIARQKDSNSKERDVCIFPLIVE